jgi:serine/threonine-protein kinase
MSPEQIQGSPDIDARSDLYSVGVSLCELLTGKRPFDGDSQFAILSAHLKNTPVPPIDLNPGLPRALNDVILLSVARDPNARFQSAGDFRNALASAAQAEGPAAVSQATPDSMSQGSPPLQADVSSAQAHRQRVLWMTMGGVAAALAVVAAIQFGPWRATKAALEPPPTASPAAAAPAPVPAPVPLDAQTLTPPTNPLSTPEAALAPADVPGAAQPLAQRPPFTRPNPRQTQNATRPAPGSPVSGATTQQVPAAAATAAPAGPDPQAIEAAGEKFDMLQARAASVNSSLQSFERSLAASGMNLRGDMQNAHNLMNTYMRNASEALREGDLNSAKSNMGKAEMQIGILERFLNR